MTFIEFLGFIITMVAFFLLIMKQSWEQRRRREHPEEDTQEIEDQQAQIRDILSSLNIDLERSAPVEEVKKRAPIPPPPPMAELEHSQVEQEKPQALKLGTPLILPKSSVFIDPYLPKKEKPGEKVHAEPYDLLQRRQARVRRIVGGVDSLKHAIVLKEVFGPPKGLQ